MTSKTTRRFREGLAALPPDIQRRARHAYQLFRTNPQHPGLHLKTVHPTEPIVSVRISLGYRALGVCEGETIVWFWIGSHSEYELLLTRL